MRATENRRLPLIYRCVRLHAAPWKPIGGWLEAVHAGYKIWPTWTVANATSLSRVASKYRERFERSRLTQQAQFLQSDCGSADDDTTVSRLAKLRLSSHIAPKNAWKTLGAPLSPFFQSARAVALRRRLSLLSNHQLHSPHCYSYLSQNNEGLTSHKVQEIPGPQWWAAPQFFCWGFKVTEKVRKLIGWFLSHDLRCACSILKIWDVFTSMRRGRAWKKH